MHELFTLLAENRLTVLNYASDKNQFEFSFEDNETKPSVLVCDNDGNILDVEVTKARINCVKDNKYNGNIEIYIEEFGTWEDDFIALSTTINSVYLEMYKQLS